MRVFYVSAFLESLRKYPVIPFLDRRCVQDYTIPNTNVTIEKGTGILIPILGLHYRSEYFPSPYEFNPERFSDQNQGTIPSCVYLPYGEGPRSCVGMYL